MDGNNMLLLESIQEQSGRECGMMKWPCPSFFMIAKGAKLDRLCNCCFASHKQPQLCPFHSFIPWLQWFLLWPFHTEAVSHGGRCPNFPYFHMRGEPLGIKILKKCCYVGILEGVLL
jgi:hypothetical protein